MPIACQVSSQWWICSSYLVCLWLSCKLQRQCTCFDVAVLLFLLVQPAKPGMHCQLCLYMQSLTCLSV
jgi:hypothetical protein